MTSGNRPVSLKGRALRLLARREHSRAELMRKLAPHETEPGQRSQVLDELEAKGFLSEARVVESLMHQRASQWGTRRLLLALQVKGIAGDWVDEALAPLQQDEHARAQALWLKRFGRLAQTPAERSRQAHYLMARGFGPETVRRVVQGLDDELE